MKINVVFTCIEITYKCVGNKRFLPGKRNVVCFLLGDSLVSEFYMPMFQNTLFHLHRLVGTYPPMKMGQCSGTLAYKIQMRGITQKKAQNIQNMAKV
jgi:hypothetical protein